MVPLRATFTFSRGWALIANNSSTAASQPSFAPPGFLQACRAIFLEWGRRHNAPALRLLAMEVWQGTMSLEDWATQYNVSGTWVVEWAPLLPSVEE
jgi:hypothetical protein